MNAIETVERLKQRFPNEPEYIQAVSQVLGTIEEEYNKHPEFEKANLIEREGYTVDDGLGAAEEQVG